MDTHGNGNESRTETPFIQGNGNLKGGAPMNPVMMPAVTSGPETLVQQLDALVGAVRTAKIQARDLAASRGRGPARAGAAGSAAALCGDRRLGPPDRHPAEGRVRRTLRSRAGECRDPGLRQRRRPRLGARRPARARGDPGSRERVLPARPGAAGRHPPGAGTPPGPDERLGDDLFRIRRTSIQDGAAGERTQGLISLMWNVPLVARQIETVIRRLVERNDDLRHDVADRSGINVVIVGSACGGQNSGGMLDLTYLVREALLAVGELGESSRVIGLVVLPGAFPGVRGPNFDANTHAFSVELDYLQAGGGFRARYPGGIQVASKEPPFDLVFVFDGVDERGKAFANHEEVCELAAQTIGLLLSTEVGAREIFTAVNEGGVLQGTSPAGRGTYLGTAGQAIIRFPAGPTADRCTVRLAGEIAEACLAAEPAESDRSADLHRHACPT